MRIAYVITRADAVGGASIHVRDMACEMLSRGHEVLVLSGGEGPVTGLLKCAGVPFRPLAFLRRAVNPYRDARAYYELAEALEEYGPELVSTHTSKAGWIGRAACARLGLPVLYTPHGWPFEDRMGRLRGPLFAIAERAAARWAGGIVCVSQFERELALKRRIASPERLHLIHNGVRDVPPSLRAEPGARPVRIVCVARFEPPKDHHTLLEALAALRDTDWELELVGDGPLEDNARSFAARLGIGGRIRWSGYQADPSAALARAQIFALSSTSEGFPRSILEAMRAGLPVVASDVGGVREGVAGGVSGYLVPRRDPGAMSEALGKLIKSASERQLLGTAARRIYEERFRFEGMFDKTVALYDTLKDTFPSARKRHSA
ncbi:MAG: glycosyltransferase family 4 protein [Rhodospirillales bacterium]